MIDGNPYFNTSLPRSLLVRIFKLNPSAGPGDSPGNPTHNDSIIIQERNHSCISNDNGLVVKVVFLSLWCRVRILIITVLFCYLSSFLGVFVDSMLYIHNLEAHLQVGVGGLVVRETNIDD